MLSNQTIRICLWGEMEWENDRERESSQQSDLWVQLEIITKGTDSNKIYFGYYHTDCFMESLSNKTKLITLQWVLTY